MCPVSPECLQTRQAVPRAGKPRSEPPLKAQTHGNKKQNASGTVPGAFFILTIYRFIMDVLDACNDQTSRMQQGYSSAVAMP